jgi:ribosomal protein S18 acetylase RimI-like enzyme
VELKTFDPTLRDAIEELQRKYIAVQPRGTKFVPGKVYEQLPAFEGGKNVFCALAQGKLLGYGALMPSPAMTTSPAELNSSQEIPNTLWVHIRVDPKVDDSVQDALYEAIFARALTYSRRWTDRATRIAISYPESRQDEIEYFAAQGLERFEALLQLSRDLCEPMLEFSLPAGLSIQRQKMTQADKLKYIEAENQVFPNAPRTLEDLEYLLGSWQGGCPITALDQEGNIAGSVLAYWYQGQTGFTEDVFVMPAWRGLGVAKSLITAAMQYLLENQLERAWLEVKESNQPAARLYQSLGYKVINKEIQLGRVLNEL